MKKILIMLFVSIFLFTGISCGKKKETPKYNVTIHYDEIIKTVVFEENSQFAYDALDTTNYLFLGWFNEDYSVEYNNLVITSDIDVYAKLVQKGTQYKINYEFDGGYFKNVVKYKYTVGQEYTLEKPAKDNHYEFAGWEYNGEIITKITDTMYGDITITAKWIDRNVYHTITYNTGDGEMSGTPVSKFAEGETIHLDYPTQPGYFFRGWYTEATYENRIKDITEDIKTDIVLYAKWEEIWRTTTYVSIIGDSISTMAGTMPAGYIEYYPAGDVQTKDDTWWGQIIKKMEYNFLVNASYSGSKVSNGTCYSAGDDRINAIATADHDPDMVFINMGTNDFTGGIEIKTFKRMYEEMIKKLIYKYDDIQIYVMTLPRNNYGDMYDKPRLNVNAAIREIATAYSLHLVDLEELWAKSATSNYIYSTCHPNKAGMTSIATFIVDKIKNREI